jgi:hypothetical protein
MPPKQIQTALLSGMEFIYSGEVKVHVVLRERMAKMLIRYSQNYGKSMTSVVTEALSFYLASIANDDPNQTFMI